MNLLSTAWGASMDERIGRSICISSGAVSSTSIAISNGRWDNGEDSKLPFSESPALPPYTMKLCPICATSYPADHRTCPTHGAVLIDMPELAPGTMIRDCYRIERTLGKGGMGTVYLAEHTLMGEQRALKFLAGALASNPSFVQRFLQEARAANKLHHPNIAQTYELGQAEDGSFYISMEFVDGPSLRAILEQSPKGLPTDRAFNIVRGVAEALGAAHAKRMVHRDIKPENILLAWTTEAEISKVVDFGIVAMSDSASRLTQTGRPMLTAEYAAPEQWRGMIPASELDGRTDLYSLGCVFYEMLTGSLPFSSDSYEGWFEQHVRVVPIAPSQLRPELAEFAGLDALVLRLLEKEREERPANVAEFLKLLDSALLPRQPTLMDRTKTEPDSKQNGSPWNVGSSGQARQSGQRRRTVVETPPNNESRQPIPPPPPPSPLRVEGLSEPVHLPLPPPRLQANDNASVPFRQQPGVAGPQAGISSPRKKMSGGQKTYLWILGACVALVLGIILAVVIVHYAQGKEDKSSNGSQQDQASQDSGQQQSAANQNGQTLPAVSNNAQGSTTDGSAAAKQGVALYTQKQYSLSAPLFRQACNQGNADSCDYLGWMYQHQLGVPLDYSQAVGLYNKACLADSMAGCNNLGYMYQEHLGVAQDYAKAQVLYTKACGAKLATGCDNLGKVYEYKLGVAQDYSEAARDYTKACDGGSMDGCKSLGYLYEYKLGVEQDYPRAISLYTKACGGDIADACRDLGWMYENKMGVSQDLPRAVSLYSKACDDGSMEGCNDLGYMYQHHSGVAQSYPKAFALYSKACDGGNASACNNLAVMYQDSEGVGQDYQKAAALYGQACDGGNSNGCSGLGDLYRTGNGVQKDPEKARALLTKGCSMGNQWGCDRLKQMP